MGPLQQRIDDMYRNNDVLLWQSTMLKNTNTCGNYSVNEVWTRLKYSFGTTIWPYVENHYCYG